MICESNTLSKSYCSIRTHHQPHLIKSGSFPFLSTSTSGDVSYVSPSDVWCMYVSEKIRAVALVSLVDKIGQYEGWLEVSVFWLVVLILQIWLRVDLGSHFACHLRKYGKESQKVQRKGFGLACG